jgi:hypothetical protein
VAPIEKPGIPLAELVLVLAVVVGLETGAAEVPVEALLAVEGALDEAGATEAVDGLDASAFARN